MASILSAFKAAIDPGVNTITGKVKALNRLLDQIEPLIDTLKASNPSQAQLSEVQAYVLEKIKEIDTSHTGVNERVTSILQKLNPGATNGATNSVLNAAYANAQQQRNLNTSYPSSGSIPTVRSLVGNATLKNIQDIPNPYNGALQNAAAAEKAQADLEEALREYSEPIPGLIASETGGQVTAIEKITGLNSSRTLTEEELRASAPDVEQTLSTTSDGKVSGVEETAQGGMDVKGVKVAPFYSGITRFIPFVQNNWGSTGRVVSPPDAKYVKVQYKFEDTGDEKTVYFYKDDSARISAEEEAKKGSGLENALGRAELPPNTIFEQVTRVSLLNDENATSENKYKILLHTGWGSFGFRLPTNIAEYERKSKQFQSVLLGILGFEDNTATKGGRRINKRSSKKTRKQMRKLNKGKKRSTRK